MYNSTWGNSYKPIRWFCPALCGQREYDATLISQSSLKNDSWYIRWLQTEGNRLYDLENQLTRYYFQGSPHDYALIEDHKQKLMNDSSVLHFYFDNLQFEKKRAFEPPSTPSISYSIVMTFKETLSKYSFLPFRFPRSIDPFLAWGLCGCNDVIHSQTVHEVHFVQNVELY